MARGVRPRPSEPPRGQRSPRERPLLWLTPVGLLSREKTVGQLLGRHHALGQQLGLGGHDLAEGEAVVFVERRILIGTKVDSLPTTRHVELAGGLVERQRGQCGSTSSHGTTSKGVVIRVVPRFAGLMTGG